jgi:hypothetical protein
MSDITHMGLPQGLPEMLGRSHWATYAYCFGCESGAWLPNEVKHAPDCTALANTDAPYSFWLGADHG